MSTPTPQQTKALIDDAVRAVASWPLWKANKDAILAVRRTATALKADD